MTDVADEGVGERLKWSLEPADSEYDRDKNEEGL